ncbi:MAG: alpha/beta fold hydrolase [Solirubrobacterales bacterium]
MLPDWILVGAFDIWPDTTAAGQLAALFADATVSVLPGAGHFPWVDDPVRYANAVQRSLTS